VTENLAQAQPVLTDIEIRERMSGKYLSLRRLSQHRGGHQTSCRISNMKSFTYERVDTPAQAAAAFDQAGRQSDRRRNESARI